MSDPIKVNIDKGKLITFDLDVQGLSEESLFGKFRVLINEVEYGFPTTISENQVEVYVPCLHEILKKDHSKFLNAKLEIFADNHFFIPWEGKLDLLETASVKAKIRKTSPKVKTEIKDQDVNEDMEVIVDEPEEEVSLPKPTKKELKQEKFQNESSLTDSTRRKYLEKLKGINMDGIRSYMARAGTRNEKVQNVILEQAENICKDPDNKFELLKSVVKVMAKFKKGDKNV